METHYLAYVAGWSALTIAAIAYLAVTRSHQLLFKRSYFRFLFRPWKLITFAISGAGVTFLGPYTTDPTWDWIDGGFMSVLAYLTAPWATGVLWRGLSGQGPRAHIFPATCIWLFSASWSYDVYILWRDQAYPSTWWSNLVLSSILYGSAGLFWNLDWVPKKGVVLSFREKDWPDNDHDSAFSKIIWVALPFMMIAIWLTLGFLKAFQ